LYYPRPLGHVTSGTTTASATAATTRPSQTSTGAGSRKVDGKADHREDKEDDDDDDEDDEVPGDGHDVVCFVVCGGLFFEIADGVGYWIGVWRMFVVVYDLDGQEGSYVSF